MPPCRWRSLRWPLLPRRGRSTCFRQCQALVSGIWLSLFYVLGATTSFVAILVGLGMGLQAILNLIERFSLAMSLSGAAYMLYLAWRIAADSGDLCF